MISDKYKQLEKLSKTLLKSGLAPNPAEAMKRAKEMLKVEDKPSEKQAELEKLPKLEEIDFAPSGITDLDRDKSLKELVEEDAEKIYKKEQTSKKQEGQF